MEFSFNLQFKSFKSYLNSNNYTMVLKIYIYRKEKKKKPYHFQENDMCLMFNIWLKTGF